MADDRSSDDNTTSCEETDSSTESQESGRSPTKREGDTVSFPERERNDTTHHSKKRNLGAPIDTSGKPNETSRGATNRGWSDPSDHGDEGPYVSVTLEGEYEQVFERLEHERTSRPQDLSMILGNLEETLLTVRQIHGGIRSEIYAAVEFELEHAWEIRIYLEVLAMHGLVELRGDRWVPSAPPER